jgi:hypothetical protein
MRGPLKRINVLGKGWIKLGGPLSRCGAHHADLGRMTGAVSPAVADALFRHRTEYPGTWRRALERWPVVRSSTLTLELLGFRRSSRLLRLANREHYLNVVINAGARGPNVVYGLEAYVAFDALVPSVSDGANTLARDGAFRIVEERAISVLPTGSCLYTAGKHSTSRDDHADDDEEGGQSSEDRDSDGLLRLLISTSAQAR